MSIQSIEMKIVSFEDASNSVVVAFREAGSSEAFENMRSYAYQPSMFAATTSDEFIKEVAKTGVSIVEQQLKEAQVASNTEFLDAIKNEVGATKTFLVSDLYAADPADTTGPDLNV